jgi:hypothetical protein
MSAAGNRENHQMTPETANTMEQNRNLFDPRTGWVPLPLSDRRARQFVDRFLREGSDE